MSTIKSSKEIDGVFRGSRRIADPLVIALIMRTNTGRDPEGRVAFIAGKKMGNAVLRNRAKRVLRAATRQAGGPWPGYDVVLIAKPGTAEAGADAVALAMTRISEKAGLRS